jgi:hypothetical protein
MIPGRSSLGLARKIKESMPDYQGMPEYSMMMNYVLTGLKVNRLKVSWNTYAGISSMPT